MCIYVHTRLILHRDDKLNSIFHLSSNPKFIEFKKLQFKKHKFTTKENTN